MDTKGNSPMTDEEREKLAAKLDKDLDDFIGGLEKRSYSEGWPEDKWQEVCIPIFIAVSTSLVFKLIEQDL